MSQRNVTISLREDVLREARHLAVDHGLSLSGFLSMLLEERVEVVRGYRAARERQLQLLEQGVALGTEGKITWTREEVHDLGQS